MSYEPKNYNTLLGTEGFSDQLLKNHFALYQGYVVNTNKLADLLSTMLKDGKAGMSEYSELKRRFGWEWDGMRLHEFYFENMTPGGSAHDLNSVLHQKIKEQFGSHEAWEKDFKAMGMMRGIGWVILYYDEVAERLFNVWINEHDTGHFAGCSPLLVMDVFEHAFMLDYGTKRDGYVEAFFKAINWGVVEARLK